MNMKTDTAERRLLDRMNLRKGKVSIPRRSGGGDAELSFGQQRLWFMEQLESGGSEYVMVSASRVRGPLDVGALGVALGALAGRHEVLRARFVVRGDGVPVQVATPAVAALDVEVVDVSGAAGGLAGREAAAREVVAGVSERGFDLRASFTGAILRDPAATP